MRSHRLLQELINILHNLMSSSLQMFCHLLCLSHAHVRLHAFDLIKYIPGLCIEIFSTRITVMSMELLTFQDFSGAKMFW